MTSKDIRIGNFFYIEDDFYHMNSICSIISILDENTIGVHSQASSINQTEHTDNLEPIELTDEWLVKFGFEKNGFGSHEKSIAWYEKQFRILCFSMDGDYLYLREGQNNRRYDDDLCMLWNKDLKKFFYVHELQNLFFGLTGNDL